jgi:hypothetical protein
MVLSRHTETRIPTLPQCPSRVGRRSRTGSNREEYESCCRGRQPLTVILRTSHRKETKGTAERRALRLSGSTELPTHSHLGHLVTTRELWALPAEENEPHRHGRNDEDHGPRNGSRRLGAPTPPSRSGARQHQRMTAVPLRYSARQSEELCCLSSHDKRERIPSPTREMTMEQSTCRVTDERRYARH